MMSGAARGRVVLVTGGSSGIGAAVVAALRARGERAWAASRRLEDDETERTLHLDVREGASVDRALARVSASEGAMDGLVIAHGGGSFAPLAVLDEHALREDLESQVVGTFHLLRAAALGRAGSQVLVVGSIAAIEALPECAAYGAAKAAQRMLALVALEELRARGVRVTLVHPGAVDTPIWDARPGFDRAQMMRAEEIAALIVGALDAPEGAHVTELVALPRRGRLSPTEEGCEGSRTPKGDSQR